MTAGLKVKLRRKNRLMQKGRTEEANALAKRISKTTENRHKTQLRTRDGNTRSPAIAEGPRDAGVPVEIW